MKRIKKKRNRLKPKFWLRLHLYREELKFDLPEDYEEFNVTSKAMEWSLLAWDIDQMIRSLLKYHPEEYETGEKALDHVREEIHNIMEEKGLQFPA